MMELTAQTDNAFLSGRDELFVIKLSNVFYMEADDHYTHIYYGVDQHFLVPYGLSAVEKACTVHAGNPRFLMRLGRKYLINLDRIGYINFVKGTLTLVDLLGKSVNLNVSKPVLRGLSNLIQSNKT